MAKYEQPKPCIWLIYVKAISYDIIVVFLGHGVVMLYINLYHDSKH